MGNSCTKNDNVLRTTNYRDDNDIDFQYTVIPIKNKKCRYEMEDGSIYIGGFKKNSFNGHGILTFPDGSIYEGDFENNFRHGNGKMRFSNGTKYEGKFTFNEMNGKGKLTFENGSYYIGDFKIGKLVGKGKYFSNDGFPIYKGEWFDYQYHGVGMSYYSSGEPQYLGNWTNGLLNGNGILFNKDGSISVSGHYENSELIEEYNVDLKSFDFDSELPVYRPKPTEVNEVGSETESESETESDTDDIRQGEICAVQTAIAVPPPPVPPRFNSYRINTNIVSQEDVYIMPQPSAPGF